MQPAPQSSELSDNAVGLICLIQPVWSRQAFAEASHFVWLRPTLRPTQCFGCSKHVTGQWGCFTYHSVLYMCVTSKLFGHCIQWGLVQLSGRRGWTPLFDQYFCIRYGSRSWRVEMHFARSYVDDCVVLRSTQTILDQHSPLAVHWTKLQENYRCAKQSACITCSHQQATLTVMG